MTPPSSESHSIFHINNNFSEEGLGQEMRDCYQGIQEFRSAMKNLDGAGTHLTESLAQVSNSTIDFYTDIWSEFWFIFYIKPV